MKTFFDIGAFIYELLNVNELLDLLNGGKIYRQKAPQKDKLVSDIIITTGDLNENYDKEVKSGYFFINLLVPKIHDQHDITTLEKISLKIIKLLQQAEKKQEIKTIYFNFISTSLNDYYENNNFSHLVMRFEYQMP